MNVWIYRIAKGAFSLSGFGSVAATGYAGRGVHRDDPDSIGVRAQGPLPVGVYRCLRARDHERLGRFAIPLDPAPQNEMFGRSGFYIHGDNARGDYSASQGCIILARDVRQRVAGGDWLVVLP